MHLTHQYSTIKNWFSTQKHVSFIEPEGGCVCFPKLDDGIDPEKFYRILNSTYNTYVGNGHWFEMDKHFMRIGFGWCTQNELKTGLENIGKTISELT